MTLTVIDLESLGLFDGCTPEDMRPVVDAVSGVRDAAAGEVICTEGDKADRWWIVADGLADVTVGGLYTATIGAGETIGELALLDGEPRGATVTAVTDMSLHEVDGHAFLDVLLGSPRLSVALLRELAIRLRATNLRPSVPDRRAPATSTTRPHDPSPGSNAPVEFDPRSAGYREDPTVHLAAVRESAAVCWSEAISSYLVTRYDDVHRLSRSRSLVGSVSTMDESYLTDPTGATKPRRGHRMLIRRDGADHKVLRRVMAKAFTPRAISQWGERAETIAQQLLDAASDHDELDVIEDYALPLPAQIISEMLGMPLDDAPQLRVWSATLVRGLDPFSTAADLEASEEAARAMTAYTEQVIRDRRSHPGTDLLTALLEAEDAGDMLDDKDVLAQVLLLYIAGHETTLNLIGNGVTHLFRFPDQLQRWRAEPGLDANGVEEILRFESPAQLTRRVAAEPVEIDGVTLPAGSHITLSLASANHDPRQWGPTADVVDVARPGAHEHVSFGGGAHFCLGAALARLEGRVALPRLIRRFPQMAPAYDQPSWNRNLALRGVTKLPVTLR